MKNKLTVSIGLILAVGVVQADQVILDDLIVDGSTCVGQDCVNGENFGFDTLRLKENNLRIKFQDTSNSASFPTNDWQLTANDSTNGGQNRFSIDDIDAGQTPFTVEAGAGNHALYVDDGGRVGFGTNAPVLEMHVVDGDSPTLRLDQDASSGFQTQVWDIAGNETNFFVRDVTNGSRLPFKIRPGALNNALVIDAEGDVAIGAANGAFPLQVMRTLGGNARLAEFSNNGNVTIQLTNRTEATTWKWENQGGGMALSLDGSGTTEFRVFSNGDAELAGTLTENSDRNAKTNIIPVVAEDVLQKVADLPISQWQYKDSPGVNHVGPMAQDFRAAFGLGKSDTGISTLDTSGVALVAIQALKQENEAKQAKIDQLLEGHRELLQAYHAQQDKLAALEGDQDRLARLEAVVAALATDDAEPVYTTTR